MLRRANRWYSNLENGIVFYLVGILIFCSMLYVIANVVGRYGFQQAMPGMREIVGLMLVPITYLCAAYSWRHRGTFIAAEFLLIKMKGKVRLWTEITIQLLTLIFFCFILTYSAVLGALQAYDTGEAAGTFGMYVVVWPFRICVIIGLIMMGVRVILQVMKLLQGEMIVDED